MSASEIEGWGHNLFDPIEHFYGEHAYLSNFWRLLNPVTYEGMEFVTVEHAYQAAKTLDMKQREQIKMRNSPSGAKALGRHVTLRDDWNEVRVGIMRDLIAQKFAPGTELAAKLIATGQRTIIEGNTWNDKFWGVCNGQGLNWLGELLMRQREALTGK